jgi:hypothetical protein
MPSRRERIELGNITNLNSPRFRIAVIKSEALRTSIQGYLTVQGVEIGRSKPPGWFQWLNEEETIFQARCGEPPSENDTDDGRQPFNFFIHVRVTASLIGKTRYVGVDFYHEDELGIRPK